MLNPILFPPENFKKLDTLGISVDSVNPQTLIALGACTKSHEVLTYEKLCQLIHLARKQNPNIRIKLNTVITNVNAGEDLTRIGRELEIQRWKLLRMKLFSHKEHTNISLLADDSAFQDFVARHSTTSRDVVPENDLTRSYIMVDNQGRLLDDEGEDYSVVGNLQHEEFASVFQRYRFDRASYESRYADSA